MKAIGYKNREIKGHYIIFSLLVGICGALVGTIFGLLISSYITDMYAMFFNLPEKILGYNLQVIGYAIFISTVISAGAGWSAANTVAGIQPAESMRPETPKISSHSRWNQCHLFGPDSHLNGK
jgi:putative ABC transport system permease protein